MKHTVRMSTAPSPFWDRARQLWVLALALALFAATPRLQADDEFEWDPTWGLHEEEWYDPSDWFNDDGMIDIEDVGAYGYDDPYYTGTVWTDPGYYGDYGYDHEGYGTATTGQEGYAQWDPVDQKWTDVAANAEAAKQQRDAARKRTGDKQAQKKIDKKDVVTLRGTVKNVGRAKTKGSDKEHTYAVLSVAKGKDVLVDFGTRTEMGKMKIEKGRKLQVRGPRTKFAGKYVLVAQQVSEIKGGEGAKKEAEKS